MNSIKPPDSKKQEIASLFELRAYAGRIADDARSDARLILLLDGAMGSGKTQFTQFLLEALDSHDTVSPSFAIHNAYQTARGPVHHFDFFRLNDVDDLESTGFWDLFEEDAAWIIIEWADKLNEFGLSQSLPRGWKRLSLKIEVLPGGERLIESQAYKP